LSPTAAHCQTNEVALIRPRRLLSLGHSYVVSLNRRLASEMSRAGTSWEVTAAAPEYFYGPADLYPHLLQVRADEPCPVHPLRAYFTKRVHFFVYGASLWSLLRQGWDLIHCWEEPYVLAGGQIAHWTPPGSALVFRTAQGINKQYPVPFNWIERYAMARAAGWIASARTVTENLAQRPGYADRPTCQIPLGVDVNLFRPDAARGEAVRRRLGWPKDGPPVVGFLGRLVPEKGLELLTRVLDRLTTPWRALLVGAGPLETSLRAWARRHGDRVRIQTGVRHDAVPGYLNAMDVLCAPSQTTPRWREQFGRMLIEAFASGVPVLGSDCGEIPYVLGSAGVVVGESNEQGWIAGLGRLLESPSTRQELAGHGLERARSRYAWPIVARQHLRFFESLLGAAAPNTPGRNGVGNLAVCAPGRGL
jgi:glycosyltransferase involved in cell wall biosynthesis